MSSTFGGLSTAINALMAQRQALDVAGQNIANVNTPGYTRQRADLQEITSAGRGGLYAIAQEPGWGVNVADVARLADALVDARQRTAHSDQANLGDISTTYTAIEQVMNEPSTSGLSSQLTAFWSAWHDVANNPGDPSTRSALLAKAQTVTSTLNSSAQQLTSYWSNQRDQAAALVTDVNTTGKVGRRPQPADHDGQAVRRPGQRALRPARPARAAPVRADRRERPAERRRQRRRHGRRQPARARPARRAAGPGRRHGGRARPRRPRCRSPGSAEARRPSPAAAWPPRCRRSTRRSRASSRSTTRSRQTLAGSVNAIHSTGQDLNGNPAGAFFTSTGTVTAATISVAITDPRKVASAVVTGSANLDGSLADQEQTN